MKNNWARMEELRMQEENPFEYKLLQKRGQLDDYLESYGEEAKKQEENIRNDLDENMVFEDEDTLTENQRKNRIEAMAREFIMYSD